MSCGPGACISVDKAQLKWPGLILGQEMFPSTNPLTSILIEKKLHRLLWSVISALYRQCMVGTKRSNDFQTPLDRGNQRTLACTYKATAGIHKRVSYEIEHIHDRHLA